MGLFHLVACLLIAPAFSTRAGTSLLQRAASRQRSFAGLRYSPQDPAARTLLTLDTNSDGRIDPNEVAAFARSQDLDADAATKEFSSIDVNGDGVLDSTELQQVLGATQLSATEAAPASAAAVVEPPVKIAAEEQPVVAATPLSPNPSAKRVWAEATPAEATLDLPPAELISESSRISLQRVAAKVAEELGLEEKEEQQARDLDHKASEARASSSALIKQTTQDALNAGVKAAHVKTDELMAKISGLEDQAERAEVRASALRAKSKMELEEGQQLMAAAKQALTQDSI